MRDRMGAKARRPAPPRCGSPEPRAAAFAADVRVGSALSAVDEIAWTSVGRHRTPTRSAEFLQHVDAGPPVRRIDHECASRLRPARARRAEPRKPRIGFREMMEHPGADNLDRSSSSNSFTRSMGSWRDLEIVQVVFSFELLGTAHARCAEIDPGNLSRRPAQGMLGRLRCPAAGDENGLVSPR